MKANYAQVLSVGATRVMECLDSNAASRHLEDMRVYATLIYKLMRYPLNIWEVVKDFRFNYIMMSKDEEECVITDSSILFASKNLYIDSFLSEENKGNKKGYSIRENGEVWNSETIVKYNQLFHSWEEKLPMNVYRRNLKPEWIETIKGLMKKHSKSDWKSLLLQVSDRKDGDAAFFDLRRLSMLTNLPSGEFQLIRLGDVDHPTYFIEYRSDDRELRAIFINHCVDEKYRGGDVVSMKETLR